MRPRRIRLRRWLRTVSLPRVLALFTMVFVVAALLVKGCQLSQDRPAPSASAPPRRPSVATTPAATPKLHIPIRVYLHRAKRVETLDLEEYILGVVSAEMPVSFHLEALKAQAVAARSYAVRKQQNPCNREGADICTDSSHCQAWDDDASRRKKWGNNYESNLEKLTRAVMETSGEVATYEGDVIQAFFHSTSGGMTENSENAFSAPLPYLRSVVSEGEEGASRYQGEVRVTRKQFIQRVNAKFSKARLKDATLETQVEIVSTFDSGRVETIRLGGAQARGRDMRSMFDLNSTHFTLRFSGDEAIFHTIGYGHGVGMSQVGADAMAERGANYVEILTHYYTGTRVESLQAQAP